jgi:type VI secretion system protein ImpF
MSTISTEAGFSLLDLLIDEDPQSSAERPLNESLREQAVREGVERDISQLLNTRHWLGTWPPELELLKFSLLNYGLPDMTGAAIDSKPVQTVLAQTARMALEVYEPRLSSIKVTITTAFGERSARMLVSGDLRGIPEPFSLRRSVRRQSVASATEPPA